MLASVRIIDILKYLPVIYRLIFFDMEIPLFTTLMIIPRKISNGAIVDSSLIKISVAGINI